MDVDFEVLARTMRNTEALAASLRRALDTLPPKYWHPEVRASAERAAKAAEDAVAEAKLLIRSE